jgi:hypothetical protein
LVNRRLADLQWLENEMNRPVSSSLQGAREQRDFTGWTAQLQAQFDPLGGAATSSNLDALRSAQRVNQLQNEVLATAWEQKLKDLQEGKTLKYSDVLGTNPVSTATGPAGASNLTAAMPAGNLATPFGGSNTLPGPPSASNLVFVADRIQLTAQEQFRDRSGYRDAVAATMREKELDDTHDRAGMTLYTLKFDLSVIPGENNNALGRASVSICGPADTEVLYENWIESFRRTFDLELISIQRRYLQDFLTDDEERKLGILSWEEDQRIRGELKMKLGSDVGPADLSALERFTLGSSDVVGLRAHCSSAVRPGDHRRACVVANRNGPHVERMARCES